MGINSRQRSVIDRAIVHQLSLVLIFAYVVVQSIGCHTWVSKEKKKETHFAKENKKFRDLLADPDRPRLVGEVASAMGMYAKNYDAYGLVTELPGTGGTVRPSEQRELILSEMRARDVRNPEAILDAPYTALVKLRVFANPCDQKGEIVDASVELCDECLATDLTGGYVLEAKLRELAMLEGNLRKSNEKAVVSGELVMLPSSYTKKEVTPIKGVVIGGGKLFADQRLGLRILPEFRHVFVSKAIEKAINTRYFFQDSNKQKLVAEGKNDSFIVLETIPKYKHDPSHFISVILATGFGETSEQQLERVEGCKRLLHRRETARRGAIELEAIGTPEAKEVLLTGLNSSDPEIRFHSAYSLAYLDRNESIPVLMELARYEYAFRPLCLIGLAINDVPLARKALDELLQESEPELRYGAFLAIRLRNQTDTVVTGERIDQVFQITQVPSSIPLAVVSLQKKQEVVLFGNDFNIQLDSVVQATPALRLVPAPGGQIRVLRHHNSGETFSAVVPSELNALLRSMAAVQASYNDIVHMLDQISQRKLMTTPVAMNPRPEAGREYVRKDLSDTASMDSKIEALAVDRSSIGTSKSSSLSWLSPGAWWKSPKTDKNPASISVFAQELSDEERDLLNQ